MAALNLPTRATYEVHEHVKVDTTDNEDHTFCGIMFPIKAKALLPVEHIIIKSVAVRGELGPLTVYVSNAEDPHHRSGGSGATHGHHTEHGDENGPAFARPAGGEYQFRLTARHWTKVYEHTHAPSFHQYTTLTFPEPIVLYPGQVRALYVHSQAPGDEAIVYDNTEGRGGRGGFAHGPGRTHGAPRYEDAMLALYSGRAHLSPFPFGQTPIWGWGNAWRDHREFVGTIEYAARYRLWTPRAHPLQGAAFRSAVAALLAAQRRPESPLARLPDECLFYIVNMCRWDWFQDSPDSMRARRAERRRRTREREQQQQQQQQRSAPDTAVAAAAAVGALALAAPRGADGNGAGNGGCRHRSSAAVAGAAMDGGEEDDDDDDESFQDAEENELDDEDSEADSDMDDEEMEDSDSEYSDDHVDVDETGEAAEEENGDDEDEGDEDDEEEDDDVSDESDWERAHGYRANSNVLRFRDVDSDASDGETDDAAATGPGGAAAALERPAWFRSSLLRLHVLRAMAAADQVLDDPDEDVEMAT